MTEQQWLTTENPEAMLRLLDLNNTIIWKIGIPHPNPSDRKLTLWVEACRAEENKVNPDTQWASIGDHNPIQTVCDAWCHLNYRIDLPLKVRCDLLREIIGNPFRPVWLGFQDVTGRLSPEKAWREHKLRRWFTPQVLSLAQAAYEERSAESMCTKCGGLGQVRNEDDYGYFDIGCLNCGGNGRMTWRDGGRRSGPVVEDGRKGTGRIDDGTLDPVRIAVLSDALEEANATGPIVEHLRSNQVHVRGCWVLDLLLGNE